MEEVRAGRAEGGPKRLRLFIAVETAPEVQQAIAAAQQALRRRGDLPVRWTNPAQAHLTLVFLGEVMAVHVTPLADALRPVAARHTEFLLRMEGVGAFPSAEEPRVLWLGI